MSHRIFEVKSYFKDHKKQLIKSTWVCLKMGIYTSDIAMLP